MAYFNNDDVAPVFSLDRVGGDILMIGITSVVFPLLLVLIEFINKNFFLSQVFEIAKEPKENKEISEDALKEIEKSYNTDPSEAPIILNNVSKVYTNVFDDNYTAVKHVSFVVPFSECFALLGNNGAGKSTIFKIITGQLYPTSGKIYVDGRLITDPKSLANIGYCSQFDSLNDYLTVKDTLKLYASFRSVSNPKQTIKMILKHFDLEKFKNVIVIALSGGNKRKLSVAVAVIGKPSIMILDEPSCGMDPMTRRTLWNMLSLLKRQDTSVVITTHAMDEAEALSDRIGILIAGEIKAIGSSNSIRSRLGEGFEFMAKFDQPSQEKIEKASNLLLNVLGNDTIVRKDQRQACVSILLSNIQSFIDDPKIAKSLELLGDAKGNIFRDTLVVWSIIQKKGQKVYEWATNEFGEIGIAAHYFSVYQFNINTKTATMGWIFRKIAENCKRLKISEYSLNLTSLETIFNFLNKQTNN